MSPACGWTKSVKKNPEVLIQRDRGSRRLIKQYVSSKFDPHQERMLFALSPSIYKRLMPRLKLVRLIAGSTFNEIVSTSDHTWFITCGIVSYRTNTEVGGIIEAAAVGRESYGSGLEEVIGGLL